MISGLIIYNQNISGIPQRLEIEYENVKVPVILLSNSILGLQPHFYCSVVGGKVRFQENKFHDEKANSEKVNTYKTNTDKAILDKIPNQEKISTDKATLDKLIIQDKTIVNIQDFENSLVSFLTRFIPQKLRKTTNKIALVRIYLMLNKYKEAKEVLDLMDRTPDVKMLQFFIFHKLSNPSLPKDLSKNKELTLFNEFSTICTELDLHSMLLFILEFIGFFSVEYYMKIDQILSKQIEFSQLNTNGQVLSLKNTSKFQNVISTLVVYIRLQIAKILEQSGLFGMSSLFYSRTALNMFDIENSDLKVFLMSKSFDLCVLGDCWKSEMLDCMNKDEIENFTFQLQLPVEKFYILYRRKILESSRKKTSISDNYDNNFTNEPVQSTTESIINSPNQPTYCNNTYCNSTCDINTCCLNTCGHYSLKSLKVYGDEDIFRYDIVMNKVENAFDRKVIIEIDCDNLVGVLDQNGLFYSVVENFGFYYLFPDCSISIRKLIFDNGESSSVNFDLEKIEKKTDLRLKQVLKDSSSSSDLAQCPALKKYLNNPHYKILQFEYLNSETCQFFAITECQTIQNRNSFYFVIDSSISLFEIDVEICPKIYQKKKVHI